jgi:uracil-DNA glycosylase
MLAGIGKWKEIINLELLEEVEKKLSDVTPDLLLAPQKAQWFEWARLTPPESIKIIILGQDSYYTKDVAHGLAFSTQKNKTPPSLRNIYRALMKSGMIKTYPITNDLTKWAQSGILLINTAFSTELGTAGKHTEIWRPFTIDLIKSICNLGNTFTFLLWGNKAKEFKKYITDNDVLEWTHPSPMAQRGRIKFTDCDHFAICKEKYGIDWNPETSAMIEAKQPTIKKTLKHADFDSRNPEVLDVFTDGSCSSNGNENSKGSYGAVFVNGVLKGKKLKGSATNTTNVRMEGSAILMVLIKVESVSGWEELNIFSDSQFWIDMITKYMPTWSAEKFDIMKNPDLTKQIWKRWKQLSENKHLSINFVPAHNKTNWKDSDSAYERWCFINNDRVDKWVSS